MTITIHRGKDQIGGCITQITSQSGSSIIIDLGHNLPKGDKPCDDNFDKADNLATLLKGVTDVYYTHYHGDHIGFEAQVDKLGVKQHIGGLALKMMKTLRSHMANAPLFKEDAERSLAALENFSTYHTAQTEHIGDIAITPFYVSHSAIDAYMFLIECDGKRVLHTGDFREHGYLGKGLMPLLEKIIVKYPIDVLITEGTMLGRSSETVKTEDEIRQQAAEWFQDKKYVFVLSSSTDADRLVSMGLATKAVSDRRCFVTDTYQQRQIYNIQSGLTGIYQSIRPMSIWCKHENTLWCMKKYGFTMMVRKSETFEKLLAEIVPQINLTQTLFIYSQFHGYINPNHDAYNPSIDRFVHLYDWEVKELHTSGHATKETLAKVCNLVNPHTAIIPIHKEANTDYSSLDIANDLKGKIVNESMTINNINIVFKESKTDHEQDTNNT